VRPRTKAAVIAAIKQAEAVSLADQDSYRPIIKAALATPATEKHEQLLIELGVGGIEKLMEGECYPPTGEDWKVIKGYEWNQMPRRLQLEQVEDKDISFWLYMLGEVTDHTQRLKAMAKFFGYFGAISIDINKAFICWQAISTLNIVVDES